MLPSPADSLTLDAAVIREHSIPTADSGPYSLVAGPDGNLWFCESRAHKIARFSPADGGFAEYPTPTPGSRPIGMAVGPDGNLWFAETRGHRVGRITMAGAISEFPLPTKNAGPEGVVAGPDGNIWVTEHNSGKLARMTLEGDVTEFGPYAADSRPLGIRCFRGELLASDPGGSRILRITQDGRISAFPTPRPATNPRFMALGPDGNVWFTLTDGNALGRMALDGSGMREFRLSRPQSSARSIVIVADEIWYTDEGANLIGVMDLDGTVLREYPVPTPKAGLRAMAKVGGSLYFSEFDVGKIGELFIP